MKKIIFCDIPMKSNLKAMVYKGTGNVNTCYNKPIIYPINAVLADTLKKDDEIKVILLRTENPTENNTNFHSLIIGASGNNGAINSFNHNWFYDANNPQANRHLVEQIHEIKMHNSVASA